MADEFDPYHIWLGIPPEEQPANHYRLLGISLFEKNPEVIRDAVMQRMAHIRTYQLGKYQALSQKILNELAVAKVCLQDPTSKAAYDEKLRQQAAVEAARQAAAETRKQLESSEKLLETLRKKKVLAASIGLGLAGVIGIVLLMMTIRVRHPDGKETVVTVPNGSQVTVSEKGNVDVAVKEKGGKPLTATYGPNAPPPAVAPFDAAKAKQHQEAWAKHLGVPLEQTNSIGMPLVLIPPGEFEMGSTPEKQAWEMPAAHYAQDEKGYASRVSNEVRHHVKITKPFYLGLYQVTQEEYEKVMGTNPSAFTEKQMGASAFKPPLDPKQIQERKMDVKKVLGKDTSRHPVETISWNDATEFCRRLSAMPSEQTARRVYRLPTEAEWEYACRAGTTSRWYCGDDEAGLVEVAWFKKNAGGMTHPVGEKKPNAWGLYDMSGNVNQWCSDWFSADYYKQSPPNDPTGPPAGSPRVLRGGNWNHNPSVCCSASRNFYGPATRIRYNGFRVVADVVAKGQEQPTTPTTPHETAYGPNAPSPAVAPFDATRAKQHQENWAKHLGVPLKETNSIGMPMVLIPPGEFEMGSTPEEVQKVLEEGRKKNPTDNGYFERLASEAPRHHVKINTPFYLGVYQVTQSEYEKVMGVNPSHFTEKQMDVSGLKPPLDPKQIESRQKDAVRMAGKDTSRHPVEMVNWNEAMEFCRKLSAMPAEQAARRVYRLPTEAEWEYACRAGTMTGWYCGDDEAGVVEVAWFNTNAGGMTHPVGEKKPNAWSLYDMHGNVWQWCTDWFSADYYKQSPPSDPTGPTTGQNHVLRGGYWSLDASHCRSAYRHYRAPAIRNSGTGFRVVVDVVAKEPIGNQPTSPVTPPKTVGGSNAPGAAAGSSSSAARSTGGAAAFAVAPAFPWLGYHLGDHPPRSLNDVATYTNVLIDNSWTMSDDGREGLRETVDAARKVGLPVIVFVHDRQKKSRFLDIGIEQVRQDRDVIFAIASDGPDFFRVKSEEVSAFGKAVKRSLPGIGFWVNLIRTSYPLPPEVEGVLVDRCGIRSPEAVEREVTTAWPKLVANAAGRPVVILWDCWQNTGEGIVPVCKPGTFRVLGDAVRRQKLAGITFAAFGSATSPTTKNTFVGLQSRPDLVEEIRQIGKAWGIGQAPGATAGSSSSAAGSTGGQAASGTQSPIPNPQSPAPPPAVAPFDATQAKQHQEAWAKHLGVEVEDTNSIGMKLVLIPPGEFDMGSTPEEKAWAMTAAHYALDQKDYASRVSSEVRHHVKITKPFYLAMYPVTQGEYEKVMGVNPSGFTEKQMDMSAFRPPLDQKRKKEREKDAEKVAGRDTSRHPVETVNWDEAMEFCRRLSAMPAERAARRVYRLPTEAEWEYACRAGTTSRWYCGDDEAGLTDYAWFAKNAGMTHPVGEKKPNAWGLYDMSGNVNQWCSDWFGQDYYKQSPPNDPGGPPAGSLRVVRGGRWNSTPSNCRSAFRISLGPADRYGFVGFRVVVGR